MPRKVKRGDGCTGRPRRSRSGRRKRITLLRRKRGDGCGSRKRRQSRKRMRGGFNEEALKKVLDDALNATSGGALSGARLNGGQGGGSRRRTKRARRTRRARSSRRARRMRRGGSLAQLYLNKDGTRVSTENIKEKLQGTLGVTFNKQTQDQDAPAVSDTAAATEQEATASGEVTTAAGEAQEPPADE
tara:strand:+ start:24 stop:587 length:564 start_codon:yes stop_codon:yes gene_type:complete